MPHRKTALQIIQTESKPMEPEPTGQEPRLTQVPGIRAIVWDVYGTLVQSGVGDISLASKISGDREALMREAFTAAGFRLTDDGVNPLAELFQDTLTAQQDIRRADDVEHPEVDIVAVWEDFLDQLEAYQIIEGAITPVRVRLLAVHWEVRVNPVWPMPGMPETLAALRKARKPMAIISNAQFFTPLLFPALLDEAISSLGFLEDACVWSYELKRAKPSFTLYETCAEFFEQRLKVKPSEILYVGNDMLNDIYPAHEMGMKTALFAGDARSLRLREDAKECKGIKPDVVITELPQLLDCI